MNISFSNVIISGISSCIPRNTVDVLSFSKLWPEDQLKTIIKSSGINRIAIAPEDVTSSDLCFKAAEALLEELKVDRTSIDGLIFVSQTPDHILPTTSAILQHRLGLSQSVIAFDIPNGCAGYVLGTLQASMMISSGACRRVLVLAGDTITRRVSSRDRSVKTIFGDAGSATIVEFGNGTQGFATSVDGSGSSRLIIPAGGSRLPSNHKTNKQIEKEDGNFRSQEDLFMDGMGVMNFALKKVPETVRELLQFTNTKQDSINFFGLHQANEFMISFLSRKLKIKTAQSAPFLCSEIGNTGPASIPTLLSRWAENSEENPKKSVLCGFGVGLHVGAQLCDLSKTKIIPPINI